MQANMVDLSHDPSPELMRAVRAVLVLRGQSLGSWARANGVQRQNLCKAILGEWDGPKARDLIDRLRNDLTPGGA